MTNHPRATVRARLANVCWLGGGSGAGKSTIARRIAAQHGWNVYSTDEVMADHGGRLARDRTPYLDAFAAMDMDERWVSRSPQTMLDTFHWYRGEGFTAIVEDLLELVERRGVIAEGFRLLPELVAPLLADRARALWLLPTPEFRRAAFDARGTTWEMPRRTSAPELALRNLLERDRMFTDRLRDETRRLGLQALEVDGSTSAEELAERVTRAFAI